MAKDKAVLFEHYWSRVLRHLTEEAPPYVREHRFHPTRRWRFDVAFVEQKVAVEIDGGCWSRGRHTRGSGYIKDTEKLNAAVVQGWRVLRYCTHTLEEDPLAVVTQVLEVLDIETS